MYFACVAFYFVVFKQKTAYEMRISDWSSDVCSSDLGTHRFAMIGDRRQLGGQRRAGWIAVELPQCAQRFGRCQCFVEPLQAALVDATDDGENQIVDRKSVV